MDEAAGLLGGLFFLGIWGLVFAWIREGRAAMLKGSAAFAVVAPCFEYWHLADYWHPEYLVKISVGPLSFGLEDLLFSFAFSGICIGLFCQQLSLAGTSASLKPVRVRFADRFFTLWPGLFCFWVLVHCYSLNSLHAIAISCLVSAGVILWQRPCWTRPALRMALLVAALMWFFYWGYFQVLFPGIIERWWEVDALWCRRLAGVPLEEPLWALAAAFFIGPAGLFYLE